MPSEELPYDFDLLWDAKSKEDLRRLRAELLAAARELEQLDYLLSVYEIELGESDGE